MNLSPVTGFGVAVCAWVRFAVSWGVGRGGQAALLLIFGFQFLNESSFEVESPNRFYAT